MADQLVASDRQRAFNIHLHNDAHVVLELLEASQKVDAAAPGRVRWLRRWGRNR